MGINFGFFKKMGVAIFSKLLRIATPEIRDSVCETLFKLNQKAMETDNPIDDLITGLLLDIFEVSHPD